jgi:phage terminase large subunit
MQQAASPQLAQRALARIRRDPVGFAHEVLGVELWSKQREIVESVRDNPRTAVRSCHGVGKTASAAVVVLWFLCAFGPRALVVTTAPTWRQVRDLLWREIAKLHGRASGFLDGTLTETRLDFAPDWYAVGLSTNQPENFQGYHAPALLFVVDEASGVDQQIFDAAEGFLTGQGSRVLLIGNPTRVTGQFYDAFNRERALWNTIHVAAFDSPNFTGEPVPERLRTALVGTDWVDDKKQKWGETSPIYQVRVLGNFPPQSDQAVISLAQVEAAQARDLEPQGAEEDWPLIISCDPARFGADETVIAKRRNKQVRIMQVVHGQDTMETVGHLLRVARATPSPLFGKPVIVVDEIGIGAGIVDRLREVGEFAVIPYNASAAAAAENEREYPNARSELWFEFAEEWLPVLDLDGDDQLAADLLAPEYKIDSRGRRVVEAKEETKKRLGRSPDRADAVLMCFSRPANARLTTVVPVGLPQSGGSKWR